MLKVGEKVLHYVDAIEGFKMFEITKVDKYNRCTLKGVDTETNLVRVLDNSRPGETFHYKLIAKTTEYKKEA